MAQKRYYWLKLQNNFFQDIRMKKLKKIAGGDTITIIYLKMQLLSLTNNGTLFYEELEESFAEEIALQIDENIENVELAITYLMNVKLLEQVEAHEYILTETIKNIGSESESAERVRQFRAKKEQKSLQCNTNVTLIRDREDKELELDEDIKEKKTKKGTKCPTEYRDKSIEIRDKDIKSSCSNSKELDENIKENENNDNLFEFLETNFGRLLSPIEYEKIIEWEKHFSQDIIKQAIKECCLNNAKTMSYLNAILKDWQNKGYKKVSEIENRKKKEEPKKASSKLPEWFNKENEIEGLSEGEKEEMEKLLNEFIN